MTITALQKDARESIEILSEDVDLLIGIPSYNCAETIGHVIQVVAQGIRDYFPSLKAIIVVADGQSEDRTRERANEVEVKSTIKKIVYKYKGLPGKGSALRSIFEVADLLNTKANTTVDADLTTITPEWMELLLGPIINRWYDYITPYYTRHKYDGTITNSICYPLTRALYGRQVRQPIGGDFGFSTALARTYLMKDVWESHVARFGIDIWMTTIAINEGFKIAQVNLGSKGHAPKDPSSHLGPMFKQVVSTLFETMGLYEKNWRNIQHSVQVPIIGEDPIIEIPPMEVDLEAMVLQYKEHINGLHLILDEIFSHDVVRQLEGITKLETREFLFPVTLWVKAVYDIAVAYHYHRLPKETIVETLIPIYLGRTAAFIIETKEMNSQWAEQILENQCHAFEIMKPYLLTKWSSKRPC